MKYPSIGKLKPQGVSTIARMQALGMRVRAINIVYFEGINTDLVSTNDDKLDEWNDVRCIITDDGDVLMAAQATTEPGRYYTFNRMNLKGAFRIQLDKQFKDAWTFGKHFRQDALVQCGTISGHRDDNEDGKRTGDLVDVGSGFGVNQHTTNAAPGLVGKWSAGCLVGRYPTTHATFLEILRYSGNTTFDTVVFGSVS
jgi:hypothetical protein